MEITFNKKNLLLKILNIQEITKKYTDKGVTKIWIYKNIIYPNFFISYVTFFNYLNTNARKELRKFEVDWKEVKILKL